MLVVAPLFASGCRRETPATLPPRSTPLIINVIGQEYQWRVVHPGPDDQPGTDDDVTEFQNVHVPSGTPISLQLSSADLLYTLSLPDENLKQIAVPEMLFTMEFESGSRGTYRLRGDQLCGFSHTSLIGKLVVLSPHDYAAWLARRGN